jgi:hypothetical protein
MKCLVEMGPDAMIYIPTKFGSATQKLIVEGRGRIHIHRPYGDRISLFLFFKIRKAG